MVRLAARGVELGERVEVSSGSCAPTRETSKSWHNMAMVPRLPWIPPTTRQLRSLCRKTTGVGGTVALLVNEHCMVRQIQRLLEPVANERSFQGAKKLLTKDLCGVVMSLFGLSVEHLLIKGQVDPRAGGLCVRHPGVETVTTNSELEYVGLHVDDWLGAPLSERSECPGRVCMNCGREPRRFLFMERTLVECVSLLEKELEGQTAPDFNFASHPADRWIEIFGATAVTRALLKLRPDLPVISVLVLPGEMYIAPTENVIHDASTSGTSFVDITASLRGHFKLAAT
jgi:hypothetical protein